MVLQNGQALMPVVVTGAKIEMFRSVKNIDILPVGLGPQRDLTEDLVV